MKLPVLTVEHVASAQLCCGCGACASACPDEIEMIDVLDHGRRPRLRAAQSEQSRQESLRVCPGLEVARPDRPGSSDLIRSLLPEWGPVLELWEGFAGVADVRFKGSSGGAASALAIHAIEQRGYHGVLHIAPREDVPYLNRTVLSRTRDEIVAATGSRYAPASPCDSLHLVERAPGPCVFIGKPCDVAALERVRSGRPALDRNIGLTIAVFCAGTPSTRGTLAMLREMGVEDPASVLSVRYRGNGWPGNASVTFRDSGGVVRTRDLSYAESWGAILERHRQWRCYVCADHTGEHADISVGDPWYREIQPGEPGRSLVVVRTPRGREALRAAVAAGALSVERVEARILPASQPNLLATRGAVWGRIASLRLAGLPAPRFPRMRLFRNWALRLSAVQKLRSFTGTFRRIRSKRLAAPAAMTPYVAGQSAVSGSRAA